MLFIVLEIKRTIFIFYLFFTLVFPLPKKSSIVEQLQLNWPKENIESTRSR